MPDTENTSTPAKSSAVVGLDKPFPPKEAEKMEGVDSETGLFHGIHPDTKERIAVTLEGLKAEFGDKLGEQKYLAIAGMNGGSVFFNPQGEATSYRPPLGVSGLKGKVKEQVDAILASKE